LRNAEKEGINLSEITLFYSNLDELEELELKRKNLVVSKTGTVIIGRFTAEGIAIFPDKISAVYYLGA
jgi:hypothetical protein